MNKLDLPGDGIVTIYGTKIPETRQEYEKRFAAAAELRGSWAAEDM